MEVAYTTGGRAFANGSIASEERWFSKEKGHYESYASYFDFVVWGEQAERLSADHRNLKGCPVVIEGKLRQERWEDTKTGVKKQRVRLVVGRIQMLFVKPKDAADDAAQPSDDSVPPLADEPPGMLDDI
jgi:single stranded DNA-binding protein